VTTAYARSSLKCAETVLAGREVAEVFLFAAEGLRSDLPLAEVLRKRLQILIDQFARD
jgi:hypothetical protein